MDSTSPFFFVTHPLFRRVQTREYRMVPSQSGVVCSPGMQASQTMLESLQATCCKVSVCGVTPNSSWASDGGDLIWWFSSRLAVHVDRACNVGMLSFLSASELSSIMWYLFSIQRDSFVGTSFCKRDCGFGIKAARIITLPSPDDLPHFSSYLNHATYGAAPSTTCSCWCTLRGALAT